MLNAEMLNCYPESFEALLFSPLLQVPQSQNSEQDTQHIRLTYLFPDLHDCLHLGHHDHCLGWTSEPTSLQGEKTGLRQTKDTLFCIKQAEK